MACYKPLTAWQREDGEIVFAERGRIHRQLTLACGQCIGCRLERSRQWAIRCMHEAKTHRYNSFVTLTYKPEHLPENGQLVKRDAVLFNKRLLKALVRGSETILCTTTTHSIARSHGATPHTPAKPTFRFYLAGEYGEKFGRPHFHICLFGIDFADKKYLAKTGAGSKLYRSPTLEKIWTLGHSSVGELTFESAAYAARYVMKKITGRQQKQHYEKINPETGEVYNLEPEYNNMSRNPGIGKAFLEKYYKEMYPEGKTVIKGKLTNTPRYYDKQYAKLEPLKHEALTYGRYIEGLLHAEHQTPARLRAREQVAQAKIRQLKRSI